MRRLYQVKLNQLKNYQEQLDNLELDFKKIGQQISATSNLADRQRLQRQQELCGQEMDEVAQKYDNLEEGLKKDFSEYQKHEAEQEALNKLKIILTEIRLEKVVEVYRVCLPEGRPPRDSETKETLIERLAQMPDTQESRKPLFRFVMLLCHDKSLTMEQQNSLKEWGQEQGLSIEQKNGSSTQSEGQETCLMVQVQPCALNNPDKGYWLRAVLFFDENPMDCEIKLDAPQFPVPHPSNPQSKVYKKNDLETALGQFINNCGTKYQIALTDLIVQLFVPIELMSLPFEHWQFTKSTQCCGHRCKGVIVRSYERHFLKGELGYERGKGDWGKYWQKLLNDREARCVQTLAMLDPVKGKIFISSSKREVLGCRFIEHHQAQQQKKCWESILDQGLPVALWIRSLSMTEESWQKMETEGKKLMGAVTRNCAIAKLPESLAKKRQTYLSNSSECERQKKARCSLLWDNPFRSFPTIDYHS